MHLAIHLPRRSTRVLLRRLTPDDVGDFQAYRRDPVVGRYQGWSPMSDADAVAFLATMQRLDDVAAGTWVQVGIAAVDDGRLVGDGALRVRPGATEAEIGFTLAGPAQGRGLGREAVDLLVDLAFAAAPVAAVVAVTDARNAPARRVLAAAGLRHAETHDAVFRGEECVEHTFVVTRADRSTGDRAAPAQRRPEGTMPVHGACHCGAIAYEADVDPTRVTICHCTDCQRLTGSAYRVTVSAAKDDFRLLRGTPTVYVKVGDAGSRRAQAFCATCGSSLYTYAADAPVRYGLRVGCIAERAALVPTRRVWCDSALAWSDDLRAIPGAPRE